jgi:pimeloyl-ACP methyl ester carboxylesterase
MGLDTMEIEAKTGPESLTLEVTGHLAHYLKAGSGPPVVLVHGGASDSRDWLGNIPALSPFFTVYAPDLIGFGRSGRNEEGYYITDFSDFLEEFIEKLGLSRPALVGHSLGARACLGVALRRPELVGRLVLVDAAGLGKVSRFGTALNIAIYRLRQLLGRPQPYPRFKIKEGEDMYWRCMEELPGLSVPTLIIWKRHDPYIPLSVARHAAALIPGAILEVLPGFGHAPQSQNREEFNRLLLDFLGE